MRRTGSASGDQAQVHLEGHASLRELTHPSFYLTTESIESSDEARTLFGRLPNLSRQGSRGANSETG